MNFLRSKQAFRKNGTNQHTSFQQDAQNSRD